MKKPTKESIEEAEAATEQFELRIEHIHQSYVIDKENPFVRDVVAFIWEHASIWEQFGPYEHAGMIDVIFEACLGLPEDQKKDYKEFIGYLLEIYRHFLEIDGPWKGQKNFRKVIYDIYKTLEEEGLYKDDVDSRFPDWYKTNSGLFAAIKDLPETFSS